MTGLATVEGLDEVLRTNRHLVLRAIREVDELLRMADHELATTATMTVVRSRRGVAPQQRVFHRIVRDGATPTAATDCEKLAVPSRCRKPDFDTDGGVRRGLHGCRHPAERRQLRMGLQTLRFTERTRGDRCRDADIERRRTLLREALA